MKRTTLALLTVAAAASMAGIANAVPFGPNNIPPGLSNQGGLPPGLSSQGAAGSNVSQALQNIGGPNASGFNPLVSLNTPTTTPVSTVPEGSSVLLLSAGLVVLALTYGRWQRRQVT